MEFSYEEMFDYYGMVSLASGSELIPSVKMLKQKVDNMFSDSFLPGENIDMLTDKNINAINTLTDKIKGKQNESLYKNSVVGEKLDFNIKVLNNYKQMLTGKGKDVLYIKNIKKYEKGEISFGELLGSVNDKTHIKNMVYQRQMARSSYREIPPENEDAEKEDSHFVFVKYDDKNKTKQRVSVKEALEHNRKVDQNITNEVEEIRGLAEKLTKGNWKQYLETKNPQTTCSIINVGKESLKQGDSNSVTLQKMASYVVAFNFLMKYNYESMNTFKMEERRLRSANVKFTELDNQAIDLNNTGMELATEAIKESESIFKKLLQTFKTQQAQENEETKQKSL